MKKADKELALELLKDKDNILSRFTSPTNHQRIFTDDGTYIVGYDVFDFLLRQSLIEKAPIQQSQWFRTDYVGKVVL